MVKYLPQEMRGKKVNQAKRKTNDSSGDNNNNQ